MYITSSEQCDTRLSLPLCVCIVDFCQTVSLVLHITHSTQPFFVCVHLLLHFSPCYFRSDWHVRSRDGCPPTGLGEIGGWGLLVG